MTGNALARLVERGLAAARPSYEIDFLPAALEISDRPPSPLGRAIGATIIAVAVIALLWACIGKIDITASAPGRIVPMGKTKVIQPTEIGTISAIHVNDGDHVAAGAPLIEMNSLDAMADRDRYARDILNARLDHARLAALIAAEAGAAPVLTGFPMEANAQDRATAQAAAFAQSSAEAATLAELDQQIAEKDAEAAEAAASIERLQASLPMMATEADIRQKLKDMEFGNKLAWLDAEQRLADERGEIPVYVKHRDGALAAKAALERQREATEAQYKVGLYQDLDKSENQISELTSDFAKASERLRLQILRAPIDGTVQQLAIHTIGGVVTPAEPLMVVVPDQDGLVVEATVENRDVGFVHAGQTARVKIEAFPFTRYGLIDGTVLSLTRDAVDPPRDAPESAPSDGDAAAAPVREPGYVVLISLSRNWMPTESGRVALGPGMSVTAEIQTGQRRIIGYLLSPFIQRVDEGMHER